MYLYFPLPEGVQGDRNWDCGWLGRGLTCEYTLHTSK